MAIPARAERCSTHPGLVTFGNWQGLPPGHHASSELPLEDWGWHRPRRAMALVEQFPELSPLSHFPLAALRQAQLAAITDEAGSGLRANRERPRRGRSPRYGGFAAGFDGIRDCGQILPRRAPTGEDFQKR